MRVYVVTSGIYSDYMIKKIFLNRDKAEEYKEWLYDANDIEEYDTADDDTVRKVYIVHVTLEWYPTGKEKLNFSIYRDCESCSRDCQWYTNYGNNFWEEVGITRIIHNDNFDEERIKDKYTKVMYDLKARILSLKADGYNEKQIREILYNMESDK